MLTSKFIEEKKKNDFIIKTTFSYKTDYKIKKDPNGKDDRIPMINVLCIKVVN